MIAFGASQVVLVVKKKLSAKGGDRGDLGYISGWEDSLEEGMAVNSSILAWRIPWTEKPGELCPEGRRVRHD